MERSEAEKRMARSQCAVRCDRVPQADPGRGERGDRISGSLRGIRSGVYLTLFPPDEQQKQSQIGRECLERFDRLDEAWRKDPKSVNPADLDAWLAELDPGFKLLDQAQDRPDGMFPCPLSMEELSLDFQAARSAARAIIFRVRREIQQGDLERSIRDVESVLRLSRDLRHRGDDLSQLVSTSIDGMCCNDMIREILAAPGLKPEHCDRLLAALAKHEAEATDPFLESQQVEYLKSRKILYDLEHRTGAFDKKVMQEKIKVRGPVDSPLSCINLIVNLGGFGGPLASKKWGTGGSALPAERRRGDEKARRCDPGHDGGGLRPGSGGRQSRLCGCPGLAGQDDARAIRVAAPGLVEPLQDTNVAVFLEPRFLGLKAFLRSQTLLRGTECLVALRRWQFEHKEPPRDLETLAKAAGMKDVPIDPYSDQPLRMTMLEGSPVVYSIGADGKDDGAKVVWDLAPNHPGDYVFRVTGK